MQGKQIYEYALIRVVPRVEREEFLNVGAILLCKRKKFLDVKIHLDEKRVSAFSDQVDLDELKEHLDVWKWICEGGKEGGEIGKLDIASRFRWLTATRSTIIQSSKVHTGVCENPELVLEDLFQKYVL